MRIRGLWILVFEMLSMRSIWDVLGEVFSR